MYAKAQILFSSLAFLPRVHMKIYTTDLGGQALQYICAMAFLFEEIGYDQTSSVLIYL